MKNIIFILASCLFLSFNSHSTEKIQTHYYGSTVFIGETEKNINPEKPITSIDQYEKVFGIKSMPQIDFTYLAARNFFANGGRSLYIFSPKSQDLKGYLRAIKHSSQVGADLIAAPGLYLINQDDLRLDILQALVEHTENSSNRFLLIDAPAMRKKSELIAFRSLFKTNRAALYAPALISKYENLFILTPPSAGVAGVLTRIDQDFGVDKVPAGPRATISSEGVSQFFTMSEREALNESSVNIITKIERLGGDYIWGGRHLGVNGYSPYVSVSRFIMLLNYSISKSLDKLDFISRNRVEHQINDYLNSYWRKGALQGTQPENAYFARCKVDSREFECQVGVALVRPNEFEVFRVQGPLK